MKTSSLFDTGAVARTLNISAAKYRRQVDCAERPESTRDFCDTRRRHDKSHREMDFCFVPENYRRLEEREEEEEEERKRRKKDKYKKVRKNVGKALRSTWKCLKLGLYNFAMGYSTPITVAATFVPDFHQYRDRPFI